MRSAAFLTNARLRRILSLAGYAISPGRPRPGDLIAVWGHAPRARRGEALAARSATPLLRIEDSFLRSLRPGRAGDAPTGLVLDRRGCHFDASRPSDLEWMLRHDPLDDPALLARAEGLIARLREAHLTKYAAVDPDLPLPDPGFVLVVDQTRGDASIRLGGATPDTFTRMLAAARAEHPGKRIIVKTHPETRAGLRPGHFADLPGAERLDTPVSPWPLLAGAAAVYTVSSQLGFEAILAGHRPQVFGLPFYAGWGLSDDRHPAPPGPDRRQRPLAAAQLAAAALLLYPIWYDPTLDRLCSAEEAAEALAAGARAWREDRAGWSGRNIRLWKRPHFQKFFGRPRRMRFDAPAPRKMVWGDAATAGEHRVEDGFLRSRGLGARLVPPLSLVLDDLGIYYDPQRESRLERLIQGRAAQLRPDQQARTTALIRDLHRAGLSKYNIGAPPPALPSGHRILVPGQVEDDASIRLGAGKIASNRALLQHVRAMNPDAVILYKPHPDVEAGLRPGAIPTPELAQLADKVLTKTDPAALLSDVQEVWTMTSLLGFEALLRGVPVTVTGRPFYAGWGLTRDLGAAMPRRRQASLAALVHATLIDYPRYLDPVSGLPCPVETAIARLATGDALPRSPALRILAKAQGVLSSWPGLWR